MDLFGKRPLALFGALFAAASVCGCLLTAGNLGIHLPVSGFFVVLALLLLLALIFLPTLRARLLTILLACLFIASAFFASWFAIGRKADTVSSFYETETDCVLRIREVLSRQSYSSVYEVRVLCLGGGKIDTDAVLSFDYETEFMEGDVLQGSALVYPISRETDAPSRYYADGILLSLEPGTCDFAVTDHIAQDGFSFLLTQAREQLSETICQLVGGEEGNLVASLLLGKRELLGGGTIRDFRRVGASHLLAISGLHLSVMILLADVLFRKLRLGKRIRCVAVLLVAAFYLALTGFALSTVRAFIMCAFLYLAYLFRCENDTVTSLFFALFLILAISPCSVYDIGMWMSFSAVLGIVVANTLITALRDHIRKRHTKWKKTLKLLMYALSTVGVSVSAAFFICFPLWLAFDEMSLLSVPSGILLSPFVTFILLLAPISLLFSPISWLAPILGGALRLVCRVILWAVSWASSFRKITVSLNYPIFSVLIPLGALIIGILLVVRLKHKWVLAAAAGAMILCFGISVGTIRLFGANAVTADFRSLGEDEILVFTGNEESVICDMTAGAYSPVRLASELSKVRYATEIGAYVLTHYHSRQISTLNRLFSSAMVRRLCLPMPKTDTEFGVFSSLITVAHKHCVDVLVYDRGMPFEPAKIPLSITVSPEAYLKRSTHPTFFLSATSNGKTLLYTGESAHESDELYQALCHEIPNASVVLFGVHGPVSKSNFLYPTEEVPYVLLSDEALLPFWTLKEDPSGEIVSGADRITIFFGKDG